MVDCDCLKRPDAVDKTDWKCNKCGTDLEDAHKDRQEKARTHYETQALREKDAVAAATIAYNKVFADKMKMEEKEI